MVTVTRPREEWYTLLLDAHAGYVSWAQYEENLERLRRNNRCTAETRRCPPREGPALLQGLVLCGACGARMTVRYQGGKKTPQPYYVCQGAGNTQSWPSCQSFPGTAIDAAIGTLLLEARIDEADQLRLKQVERARYEAELARGRFMQVDANHRLVADSLEADWNEALRELERVREQYERRREEDRLGLDDAKKTRVRELAADFPRLWHHPMTPHRERKRMARLLIEDVTLVRDPDRQIRAHVRFRGGASRSLTLPRPQTVWEQRQLSKEVVEEIDRLLDHHNDGEVAVILNSRNIVSGTGKSFDARRVRVVRRAYGLLSRQKRLRARGLLTLDQVAARLGVHKATVKRRRRLGTLEIRCHRVDDNNRFMYEDPGPRSGADQSDTTARPEEA